MKISYKGVPFYLKQTQTTLENNINTYEIPGATKAVTENTGIKAAVIPLQGFTVGPNREMIRDQLLEACRDSKPGILNHPYLGILKVYVQKISISTRFDEQNIINFAFEFVEASSQKILVPDVDEVLEFIQKIKKIREELTRDFLEYVGTIDIAEYAIKEALRAILRVASALAYVANKNPPLEIESDIRLFVSRFNELIHKQVNSLGIEDQLMLQEKLKRKEDHEKRIYSNVASIIAEGVARNLKRGNTLTREQKNKYKKLFKELLDVESSRYFEITSLIKKIEESPFKRTQVIDVFRSDALSSIYQGGGDVNKLTEFILYNQIKDPFSFTGTVEVEID